MVADDTTWAWLCLGMVNIQFRDFMYSQQEKYLTQEIEKFTMGKDNCFDVFENDIKTAALNNDFKKTFEITVTTL